MTMQAFYHQLVGAPSPLARLMRASLAQARRLRTELAWEIWTTGQAA